jgi:hypothetical protein
VKSVTAGHPRRHTVRIVVSHEGNGASGGPLKDDISLLAIDRTR